MTVTKNHGDMPEDLALIASLPDEVTVLLDTLFKGHGHQPTPKVKQKQIACFDADGPVPDPSAHILYFADVQSKLRGHRFVPHLSPEQTARLALRMRRTVLNNICNDHFKDETAPTLERVEEVLKSINLLDMIEPKKVVEHWHFMRKPRVA